ncbi:hypothetical protein [Sphingobacterium bovistauri]|uniref:Histidine kinase-, DNA gyrase B-, and HSP90-like ATPase n=1 Tax=Sphingobacterium bovistauri TaxID=2781959 RepID=A0ABS7Z2S3_9SPHI|nr:hypothetical protein [Sphingobacterium bovistauri]MCA5004447.1 hypothetical protein [Sphingobacterium bovistauri]
MTEISIPKNITPSKIENLYSRYINNQQVDNVILKVPSSIDKYTYGLLGDLLKFVITLNTKSNIKVVILDDEVSNIDRFYDHEYAYPIISLLWNKVTFIDKNTINIKATLREKQNEYFIKMNSLSRLKGNKYIFTNTDHLPQSKGLIKLFENQNGFNDDENQIKENIKKIFDEYILTFNKNNQREFESILDDIGAIVYELTKNTYEWGRTDEKMIEISESIRGVYFRFHKNKIDTILNEYEGTAIQSFFKHPFIEQDCLNDLKQVYYLEILVFDSGVGFIDKFYQKENCTDLEIIKKCLVKNQTSSNSNLRSKKGMGLDRILNILNKKGFVKILTDRYSVYRDLIKDNYQPIDIDKLDDLKLEDWNNNSFQTDNVAKSQGSYISILYPFKSNQ